MCSAHGGVDWERCLGQKRADGFKHVAALDAAVQIGVDVTHKARLTAEVQQTLQAHTNLLTLVHDGQGNR